MSIDRHHIVAAAIVRNGEVLLARRHANTHQGGLWEFPGGKVEAGELAAVALARELDEELGIFPDVMKPLITVSHDYSDKSILLDVWRVDRYSGEAHGREGQATAWVPIDDLQQRKFPEANLSVITALQLPAHYLITPDPMKEGAQFMARLEASLAAGVRLVQLRAKSLDSTEYRALATEVKAMCHDFEATLLLNGTAEMVVEVAADGLHLSGKALFSHSERPLGRNFMLSASCHDAAELQRACEVGVDFVVLSPVMPTNTHPGAETLGWQRFEQLVKKVPLPVYALGGMRLADITTAQQMGAQGIAAIGALWGLKQLSGTSINS